MNSGKRILWLEREGELSMEILTAPIIDAGCEKLKREVGFESNQLSAWQRGLCAAAALGCSVHCWSFLWQSLYAVMYCSGKPARSDWTRFTFFTETEVLDTF